MKLRMQTDMRTVGTALQHNSHFRLLSGGNRDAGKLLTVKAVSTGQSVSKDPVHKFCMHCETTSKRRWGRYLTEQYSREI